MSEERIKTSRESDDTKTLTPEELDALSGGVMEQFYKHSEEDEK